MIRMVVLSLICIIALYIFCLFRERLQKILQHICRLEAKPHVDTRSTLVKDPRTGEYYVR